MTMESAIEKIIRELKEMGVFNHEFVSFKDGVYTLQSMGFGKNIYLLTSPESGHKLRPLTCVYSLINSTHRFLTAEYDDVKVGQALAKFKELLTTGRGLTVDSSKALFIKQNEHMLERIRGDVFITPEELSSLKGPTGFLRGASRRRLADSRVVIVGASSSMPMGDRDYLNTTTGCEPQKARHEFKNDESYIQYLEHLVKRSGVFHRTIAKPLPQSAHISERLEDKLDISSLAEVMLGTPEHISRAEINGQLPVKFVQVKGGHYIPHEDEPSPFGPDQKNHVDNPWIVWYRNTFEFNPENGDVVSLRAGLKERLKNEKSRPLAEIEAVPYKPLTSDGKVALGWVIHMFYNLGRTSWEEIHAAGQARADYDKQHPNN